MKFNIYMIQPSFFIVILQYEYKYSRIQIVNLEEMIQEIGKTLARKIIIQFKSLM